MAVTQVGVAGADQWRVYPWQGTVWAVPGSSTRAGARDTAKDQEPRTQEIDAHACQTAHGNAQHGPSWQLGEVLNEGHIGAVVDHPADTHGAQVGQVFGCQCLALAPGRCEGLEPVEGPGAGGRTQKDSTRPPYRPNEGTVSHNTPMS